jgi:beta-lactam-binding protein with PASTA domain
VTSPATVPDLVGKRIGEVPSALEQANLVAGPVEVRPADPPEVGRIVDQRPPSGQAMASGGQVGLVVGVPK